ncbi:MAG TPA: glycosyltransferase family 2 protein [Geminicoccaceae bacterium]|nr:glycosyltransferase family 2 protein [Geminicoccaceae bacterium]
MATASAPLVSVIVPAMNAEPFVARTLAAATAQSWSKLEILVVDDGSTDRTPWLVEAAAEADPRIRLLRQPNRGVAEARNRAIAAARGSILAPLDADDLWHPDYLAHQVAALMAGGPGTALSYAWWFAIDTHDRVRSVAAPVWVREQRHALRRLVWQNFIGNGSSAVMWRAPVEAVGGYDPSLHARGAQGCEDSALYTALAERWDFAVATKHLVGYRRHPGGMSEDQERMRRSEELVRDDLYARRPDLPRYWRVVARARYPQRALWRALRRGEPAVAARAMCEAVAGGPLCLAAALGYWGGQGVKEVVTAAFYHRAWLDCELTRLWAIGGAHPSDALRDRADDPGLARPCGEPAKAP